MSHSFLLTEESWLPVMSTDGKELRSLRTALRDAGDLVGLATDEPLAILPMVRLLSAVVIASHDITSADDIASLWETGKFTEGLIDEYLDAWQGSFDLFGDRPFYQVPGIEPLSGGPRNARSIRLDVASGNNVPLFSAEFDASTTPLSFAEAALALIINHGYDTASIKTGMKNDPIAKSGKTTGNPTGPLGQLGGIVPWGRNLFETILLNIPFGPTSGEARPAWEREWTASWEVKQPQGYLELATWQSRRIRFWPNEDGDAVSGVVVGAGDRLLFAPPDMEPHTRWREAKSGPDRPMRWSAGQPAWRGLDSLVAFEGESRTSLLLRQIREYSDDWLPWDYPLNLICVAATYGNQSAIIEDVHLDSLPLPVAALAVDRSVRDALSEVARRAEEVRRAINDVAGQLREIQGAERIAWDSGHHPGNAALPLMTSPTERLLTGLQRQPERLHEGLLAWDRAVDTIARQVVGPMLDAAPPSSFLGRETGSNGRVLRLSDIEGRFNWKLDQALASLRQERASTRQKKETDG
ncbi:type I-E CRISPR-associated protein Cse1/CasA [Parenemella sanctibonifatiensis]|uniref:Type I-E CRISPR-associated protein Cse1/CasA n=1 Tax=Parenemella sanctibonifatiensis TaxID=2016505 RepID=A0A255ECZ5_9ACTN|nr:type I-E CRISPR-associated protein Cse1/CasA [Parenemella sanctibonifatiensis]OYN89424.1 type I-E CRISPR-associated protein Cse1/CasA [Parenemella sanctibonifatiensis]